MAKDYIVAIGNNDINRIADQTINIILIRYHYYQYVLPIRPALRFRIIYSVCVWVFLEDIAVCVWVFLEDIAQGVSINALPQGLLLKLHVI